MTALLFMWASDFLLSHFIPECMKSFNPIQVHCETKVKLIMFFSQQEKKHRTLLIGALVSRRIFINTGPCKPVIKQWILVINIKMTLLLTNTGNIICDFKYIPGEDLQAPFLSYLLLIWSRSLLGYRYILHKRGNVFLHLKF